MSAASRAIGGGYIGSGYTLDSVLGALLRTAAAVGTRNAARRFCEYLGTNTAYFQELAIINGIQMRGLLRLFDGVVIMPLTLTPYLHPVPFKGSIDQLGHTLLVVDKSVSPVFSKPPQGHGGAAMPFKTKTKSRECTVFDPLEFCQSLSLACNAPIQPALSWCHLDEGEVYNINHSIPSIRPYGQLSMHPFWLAQDTPIKSSIDDIYKARSLYSARNSLSTNVKSSLNIPIDRWVRSKANQNLIDKAIELGIAFESLYLRDSSPEIRFRLSVGAAWFLGKNRCERETIASELREFYNLRSSAVHTGRFSKKSRQRSTFKIVERAEEICLHSILQVIDDGHLPDTQNLVLGCR